LVPSLKKLESCWPRKEKVRIGLSLNKVESFNLLCMVGRMARRSGVKVRTTPIAHQFECGMSSKNESSVLLK
jgi:hypothetical protein